MPSTRADTILHPVRMRIIQRLAAGVSGRRMTPQEIGSELPEVPQATLYRHLKRLTEAGVVEIVDERAVRGTTERVFALPHGGALLGPDDFKTMSRDDHMRYFTTFVAGLLGDFARYLERRTIDLARDGVGYRQLALYLTDDELAELVQAMNAALVPYATNGPGSGRKRRMLTTLLIPTDDPEEPDQHQGED